MSKKKLFFKLMKKVPAKVAYSLGVLDSITLCHVWVASVLVPIILEMIQVLFAGHDEWTSTLLFIFYLPKAKKLPLFLGSSFYRTTSYIIANQVIPICARAFCMCLSLIGLSSSTFHSFVLDHRMD